MKKTYTWEVWWKDTGERTLPTKLWYKYPHTAVRAAKKYLKKEVEEAGAFGNIFISISDQTGDTVDSWEGTVANLVKTAWYKYSNATLKNTR